MHICNPSKDYDIDLSNRIGRGGFGEVYIAYHRQTKELWAVKKITKTKDNKYINSEARIHRLQRHSSIVQFYDHYEFEKAHYFILEYCEKGDLEKYIKEKGNFSEKQAIPLIKKIAQGIDYLHSKDIVHRDLKLGNILLDYNLHPKICDFGLATELNKNGEAKAKTFCGTQGYMSPEIGSKSQYSTPIDIWAFGIIIYSILIGISNRHYDKDLFKSSSSRNDEFKALKRTGVSEYAEHLVEACLELEQSKRITAKGILQHNFFPPENYKDSGHVTGEFIGSARSRTSSKDRHSKNSSSSHQIREMPELIQPLHIYSIDQKLATFGCKSREPSKERHSSTLQIGNAASWTHKVPSNHYRENSNNHHSRGRSRESARGSEQYQGQDHSSRGTSTNGCVSNSNKLGPPLCTTRLNPDLNVKYGKVFTIEDDGRVRYDRKVKDKNNDTYKNIINLAYIISFDGMDIDVYDFKEKKIKKPLYNSYTEEFERKNKKALMRYSYHELPNKYHATYNCIAGLVEEIRSNTPKVTVKTDRAKCILMENSDFTCKFYDNQLVIDIKHEGKEVLKSSKVKQQPQSFNENMSPGLVDMFQYARKQKDYCKKLESTLECHLKDNFIFPICIGVSPTKPSNKENAIPRSCQVTRPNSRNSVNREVVSRGILSSSNADNVMRGPKANKVSNTNTELEDLRQVVAKMQTQLENMKTERDYFRNQLPVRERSQRDILRSVQEEERESQRLSKDKFHRENDSIGTEKSFKNDPYGGNVNRYQNKSSQALPVVLDFKLLSTNEKGQMALQFRDYSQAIADNDGITFTDPNGDQSFMAVDDDNLEGSKVNKFFTLTKEIRENKQFLKYAPRWKEKIASYR